VWGIFQQRHAPDQMIRAILDKLRRARFCSCCTLPTALGLVTGTLVSGLQQVTMLAGWLAIGRYSHCASGLRKASSGRMELEQTQEHGTAWPWSCPWPHERLEPAVWESPLERRLWESDTMTLDLWLLLACLLQCLAVLWTTLCCDD